MIDLSKLTSWNSNWSELRAVVFGLGLSGFSAADTLAELGSNVLVVAESADADLLDVLDVIGVAHVTGAAAEGLPKSVVDHQPDVISCRQGCAQSTSYWFGLARTILKFGLTSIWPGVSATKLRESPTG